MAVTGRSRRSRRYPGARAWARIRAAVFDRDGWRCRARGQAGALECDHVDPNDRRHTVDACQALCRDCHIRKTEREQNRDPNRELIAQRREWAIRLRNL